MFRLYSILYMLHKYSTYLSLPYIAFNNDTEWEILIMIAFNNNQVNSKWDRTLWIDIAWICSRMKVGRIHIYIIWEGGGNSFHILLLFLLLLSIGIEWQVNFLEFVKALCVCIFPLFRPLSHSLSLLLFPLLFFAICLYAIIYLMHYTSMLWHFRSDLIIKIAYTQRVRFQTSFAYIELYQLLLNVINNTTTTQIWQNA